MLLRRTTGEVRPVHCWRLTCPSCIHRAAYVRAIAIHDARPERMLTVTQVGEDWDTVRARVRRLRYAIARHVGPSEWVWTVEANPRGTGHHVHAWQRGAFVPQAVLSRLAAGEGCGRVADIRAWHDGDEGATGYGMKQAVASGYGLKGARADAGPGEYLALNGRRLTHQSRGFFAGGVRTCERAALAARRDGLGEWEVISEERLRWERLGGEVHPTQLQGRRSWGV